MTYRNYSDEDKAVALAYIEACGGNTRQAALKADVPYTTLIRWRDGLVEPVSTESIDTQKARLDSVFEHIAREAARQTLETLDSASALQAATVMGIATEKMQLLRGDPTTISATIDRKELILALAREAAGLPADAVEHILLEAGEEPGETAGPAEEGG